MTFYSFVLTLILICSFVLQPTRAVTVNKVLFRKTWMEIGTCTVSSDKFTTVTTTVNTFRYPHVFMGIPKNGNERVNSGYQSCTRLKNVKKVSTFGPSQVTFQARITQPNDSWCNYTWWTPRVMPSYSIPYMVMEQGHYNVSGAEFDASSRRLNSHCTYLSYRHIWNTTFSNLKSRPGSIAQAQSFNDYRFMSYREVSTNNNAVGVTIFVQLHNYDRKWRPRYGNCVNFHYATLYDNNRWRQAYTMNYETVSIMGYLPNYAATCEDGIVFESHQIDGITSDSRWLPFYWTYQSLPGVFGMVNSFSGGDDITVRSFNYSIVGVGVILQEDQCDKQSVLHLQGEKLTFFAAGVVDLKKQKTNPYAGIVKTTSECCICIAGTNCASPSCSPSKAPTLSPTVVPTARPTARPSIIPSVSPSVLPSTVPSSAPSSRPTAIPTVTPSLLPTLPGSKPPTVNPSVKPSLQPSTTPTLKPTLVPTLPGSKPPSANPSIIPSSVPTWIPTDHPTALPTQLPTARPSYLPTTRPTALPTTPPTTKPTHIPLESPTHSPTAEPTDRPTREPTEHPTAKPSSSPTVRPSSTPTEHPTAKPTREPTVKPSREPSVEPSAAPTQEPSTLLPTAEPTATPTAEPTAEPTVAPTVLAKCPWNPSATGLARAGDDLAVVEGTSLGDCQNYCLQQSLITSSFVNGVCTLKFNLFDYVAESATTSTLCSEAASAASVAKCNSLEFTPPSAGSSSGSCTLKDGRTGSLRPASNPNTVTYDFNCETAEPTSAPTHVPTVIPSRIPSSTPTIKPVGTFQPTIPSKPICIIFILADTFGDSWDRSKFIWFDSHGNYKLGKSTCERDVVLEEFCFDTAVAKNGDLVNVTVFGFRPENSWEIHWQAIIVDTKEIFTGSYGTLMTFTYFTNRGHPVVKLTYAEKIYSQYIDCYSCLVGEDPYDYYDDDDDECDQGGGGGGGGWGGGDGGGGGGGIGKGNGKGGGIGKGNGKGDGVVKGRGQGWGAGGNGKGQGWGGGNGLGHGATDGDGSGKGRGQGGVGLGTGYDNGKGLGDSGGIGVRGDGLGRGGGGGGVGGGRSQGGSATNSGASSSSKNKGYGASTGDGGSRTGGGNGKSKAYGSFEKNSGIIQQYVDSKGKKSLSATGVGGKVGVDKSQVGVKNKGDDASDWIEMSGIGGDASISLWGASSTDTDDGGIQTPVSYPTTRPIMTTSQSSQQTYISNGGSTRSGSTKTQSAQYATASFQSGSNKMSMEPRYGGQFSDSDTDDYYAYYYYGPSSNDNNNYLKRKLDASSYDSGSGQQNGYNYNHNWNNNNNNNNNGWGGGWGNSNNGWGSYNGGRNTDDHGNGDDEVEDRIGSDEAFPINSYTLWGSGEINSWFEHTRDGSDMHVSDVDGYHLFHSGTICYSTYDFAPCDLSSLPKGQYMWRVTGALNRHRHKVSYDFCGVHGSAPSELIFEIDCDGNCNPLRYRGLDDVCLHKFDHDQYHHHYHHYKQYNSRQETTVTLHGSINIAGLDVDALSLQDHATIQAVLQRELESASTLDNDKDGTDIHETVTILSSSLLSTESTPSSPTTSLEETSETTNLLEEPQARRLSDRLHTHQVHFQIQVVSEHFDVDGSIDSELNRFTLDLSDYLQHSMQTGIFRTKLLSMAQEVGSQNLLHTLTTHLSSPLSRLSVKKSSSSVPSIWMNPSVLIAGLALVCLTALTVGYISQLKRRIASAEAKLRGNSILESSIHLQDAFAMNERRSSLSGLLPVNLIHEHLQEEPRSRHSDGCSSI